MLNQLDTELQKELVEFVKQCESDKATRPLKAYLIAELIKQLVNGDREITGLATNHESGDVFVRFSFTKGGQDG